MCKIFSFLLVDRNDYLLSTSDISDGGSRKGKLLFCNVINVKELSDLSCLLCNLLMMMIFCIPANQNGLHDRLLRLYRTFSWL